MYRDAQFIAYFLIILHVFKCCFSTWSWEHLWVEPELSEGLPVWLGSVVGHCHRVGKPPEVRGINYWWNSVVLLIRSWQTTISKRIYLCLKGLPWFGYFGACEQNCLRLVFVAALRRMLVSGGGELEESFRHILQIYIRDVLQCGSHDSPCHCC